MRTETPEGGVVVRADANGYVGLVTTRSRDDARGFVGVGRSGWTLERNAERALDNVLGLAMSYASFRTLLLNDVLDKLLLQKEYWKTAKFRFWIGLTVRLIEA